MSRALARTSTLGAFPVRYVDDAVRDEARRSRRRRSRSSRSTSRVCSPSSGAARVTAAGVAEKCIGQPSALRRTRLPGARDRRPCRARASADASSASPIECTGPDRHAGGVERRDPFGRACASRARRSSQRPARRGSPCARCWCAKRGSSRHSGWPSTSRDALPVRLVRAADVDPAVARVGTPGTGAVRRCAEPVGPGDSPVAK